MLNKFTTLACFALSFLFVSPTLAQGYLTPGQERVQALVDKINSCKKNMEVLQAELNYMEKHPSSNTLEGYLATKKDLEKAKECIKNSREELDRLRKDFPEWFNLPGVNIPLSKGHEINPGQLEKLVADWETAIADFIKRMEKIQKPK